MTATTVTVRQTQRVARPRDPDLDRRIIEAFRELAGRHGPTSVTISAIADHSGVSRPAIYRRWSSIAALRFEAQTSRSTDGGFADRGSFRDELIDATQRLVKSMVVGERELTASMLGQMIRSEAFANEVWKNRWGPDTDDMLAMWSRAVERGEVDPQLNGHAVMDQLVAMCIYQVMLLHRGFDDQAVIGFVDTLLDGLAKN